ncbi:MAG: FAD synthetase family protein [Thermoflexales bacterium]
MEHVRSLEAFAAPVSVCAVGTFDGVHIGHQQLIAGVVEDARARGAASVVITFFPHPKVVFGRAPALYLTLPDEKADMMRAMGIDAVVSLPFDQATIATSASDFIAQMRRQFGMSSLWMGQDFALGNRRQGTPDFLRARGREQGFAVSIVPPVLAAAVPVSSTRIREAVLRGDLHEAAECLGRSFSVAGEVVAPRRVKVPADHVLPPQGAYPVFACGALNHARLRADAPTMIDLATPVEDCEAVVVEFI